MKPRTLFVIGIAIMAVLLSCGGTETKKGMIRGTIVIEGQTDLTGITVLLYPSGLLPSEATVVLDRYPQIAFNVMDQHLFDHRTQDPLKTTQTSSSGAFSFSKVDYGMYNVVYYKDGFGIQYVTDIELNTAELNLDSSKALRPLKPTIEVGPLISGQYTFASGECYIIGQNTIAAETSNLTFEDDTRVFLGANAKLTSYGNITGPSGNGFAYVSSSDGMYSDHVYQLDRGIGMEVQGQSQNINHIVFSNLATALAVRGTQCEITECSFMHCGTGLTSYQANGLEIEKCVFYHNVGDTSAGIYNNTANGLAIHDCFFYDNNIAAQNDVVTSGSISNNAFIENDRAYLNLWESEAVFSHNLVQTQGIGLENSGQSNLTVEYSDIHAKVCVKTYHTNNWFNAVNHGWTKASYNNFDATQYAVESRAMYYYNGDAFPLDFKQNYWNTTTTSVIQGLIIDTNDLGAHGSSWVWSRVDFSPVRTGPVPTAGIM